MVAVTLILWPSKGLTLVHNWASHWQGSPLCSRAVTGMLKNPKGGWTGSQQMEKMSSAALQHNQSRLRILTVGFHFLSLGNENKKTVQGVIVIKINTTFTYGRFSMYQTCNIYFSFSQLCNEGYSYFKGEKTKAQRGSVTCLRLHSWEIGSTVIGLTLPTSPFPEPVCQSCISLQRKDQGHIDHCEVVATLVLKALTSWGLCRQNSAHTIRHSILISFSFKWLS